MRCVHVILLTAHAWKVLFSQEENSKFEARRSERQTQRFLRFSCPNRNRTWSLHHPRTFWNKKWKWNVNFWRSSQRVERFVKSAGRREREEPSKTCYMKKLITKCYGILNPVQWQWEPHWWNLHRQWSNLYLFPPKQANLLHVEMPEICVVQPYGL